MLDPISASGESIRDLLIIVTVIGAVVLLIVAGMILVFGLRYRGRPGAVDPAPVFGNARLEAVWFAVPLGIVLVLFGLSVGVARDADPSTAGRAPDLIVTGHQWWWEVTYSQTGVVTADEIHIPAGTRLLM